MHILFVCTGNTCRSSMAEAIFNNKLIKNAKQYNNITVSSAGIAAYPGDKASPNAIRVMAKRGIDLNIHKARQLTPEMIEKADLILTMTQGHKQMVLRMDPSAASKVSTLREFAGFSGDINDPFGGNEEIYEKCALEIEKMVDIVLEKQI